MADVRPAAAPGGARTPAPRPARSCGRRWPWVLAAGLLALPVLATVGAVAALWQGLHSEAGTRWWLEQAAARVPGLQAQAPRGALLGAGAEFSLARLVVQAGRHTVRIDGLRCSGLQVSDFFLHAPHAHLGARLLAATRITVESAPATEPSPPAAAPTDLRLPVTALIDSLRIDELRLPAVATPLQSLSARLEVGPTHRIDALQARWNGLQLQGAAQLGADAPMALRARADVRSDPLATGSALPAGARELTLAAEADGPLAAFDAQAALAMQAQRLDAKAQVTPFAAAPLRTLDARFDQLDLSRLLAPFDVNDAPSTALSGTAQLQRDPGQPLAVSAQVRNALPGRWDARRLPVRELDVLARGEGPRWTIERARAALASDARTPAGQVDATGRLDDQRVEASVQLDGVVLQGLDARAPAWRLTGPVGLTHDADGSGGGLGRLGIDARLSGEQVTVRTARASGPKREAVQLALKAQLSPDQVTVDTLDARAGEARAAGKGRARRDGKVWEAEADLKLSAFDPTLWLAGEPTAAWRRARNVINGQASLKLQVPVAPTANAPAPSKASAKASPTAAPAWLAGLRGQLAAELSDSALGGQPLALSLKADADGRGALAAQADANAAGNRARLDLKLRTAAGNGEERLLLDVDAAALAGLSPITQALGIGPLAGALKAEARAEGPLGAWLFGGAAGAALITRGSFALDGLRAGSLQLASADAQWDLTLPGIAAGGTANTANTTTPGRAALQARLDAVRLVVPGLQVPQAALRLDGTLAEHRASLSASLRAPAAAVRAVPAAAGPDAPGTRPGTDAPGSRTATVAPTASAAVEEPAPLDLQLRVSGAWQAATQTAASGTNGANSLWRGRIQELALRPATAAGAGEPIALLRAGDIDLEIERGPQTLRASASPGRADVLGAVLRWTRARWERQGESPARMELQAEVEPFLVAPLLARLQPDFGWEGDLRMGARAEVRSEPAVSARVEITRSGGDLQVNELGTVQRLGLRELRLDLNAQDGLWRMTQVVDGETLGRLAGAQTVRTDAQRLWPPDDAAVEGALRLQVEQLSTWGAWVPAGWRLGGTLDAVLRIAGRFGAPELIGELHGRQLALRNALEGVALSDGAVDARFEGGTARLDTLRFKAGEGELRASGDARLGQDPEANLTLVAERATVLARVDRRVVASGQASLRVDAQAIKIDGDVRADEGQIDISRGDAPSLGDDVTVRRRSADPRDAARPADAAPPRPPRAVDLRLAVNLGERFRLRGRGIDTRLAGDLKLTTPAGKLTAYGEIRTERGTYEAYGQKLAIERGVITFVGDLANPRLDILAVRANTDTRVGVNVGGNAQAPRIRLFSDPELPSTEKLALLVTGRSYDTLGGTETLMLQRAALALLAGEGGGSDRFDVARALQLDELSVRQSDGAVRDTVVTLGKQISDRVYVGYERGLNAAAGNFQLIYRIAQRFTLRAQSGEDPAVDLIWVFRWN